MTSTRIHEFDLATGLTALGDGRVTRPAPAPNAHLGGPVGGRPTASGSW
ncbi:hypothetical protein [Nocardia wallacei]|nr:hypothetical protein [Nocardia wallacei]